MTFTEPKAHERRIDERLTIDLAATVRAYRVGPYQTRLVDVSPGGAMIALDGSLVARGDELLLAVGGIELVTTVAWTTGEYCGLAFHRRVTAGEMTAWRRVGRQ